MEDILQRITEFADEAHGTQKRKYADERYITHPLRVMNICRTYNLPLPVLAAAILHDVLEDTSTTSKQIRKFLLTVMDEEQVNHTLNLVIELTDVYTKDKFPKLNRRQRKAKEAARLEQTSSEAQTIKYADIIDNAKEIAQHDPEFGPVFLKECRMLIDKMNAGDSQLREQAIEVLEKEMENIA